MISRRPSTLLLLAIVISVIGCSSGPLKWNQTAAPVAVVDNAALPKPRPSSFTVLIIPSGAIQTRYISDKTSTAGGLLGSMVVGPVAGVVGGLIGSTAGSTAASSAEENASKQIDSSDIAQAIGPMQLPRYFAASLSERLNQCGIRTVVHTALLNPDNPDWATTHLVLPSGLRDALPPYRFFVEAGVIGIQVRAALKDTTMEGDAYARVYESQSLRQIGRYGYKTGSSGSVTLSTYGSNDNAKNAELQKASRQVTDYLAGGIANDMCAIMTKL